MTVRMTKPEGIPDDVWQLYSAVVHGDLAHTREVLATQPELMHYELWYEFPIHYAVRAGQADIVRLLLKAGINPARSTYTYSSWQVLLPLAIDRERHRIHDLLIAEMQSRFNYRSDYKPLWDAIHRDDFAASKQLIEDDPQLIHIGDEHGNRAIHWASLSRRIPIIQLLLDSGADINAERADHQSPLHLSMQGDYWFRKTGLQSETAPMAVTKFLLRNKPNFEFAVSAALGDTERVNAELEKTPELAGRLNKSRRSPLYHAARGGHLEVVRRLLERGADPNLPEEGAGGGRALFAASGRGDIDIMQLLLGHGADANAEVDSCGNCLSIAEHSPNVTEAVTLLKQHGAKSGQWLYDTADKVRARLNNPDPLQPTSDLWGGLINQILSLDDHSLLNQFVTRFGTEPIQHLNPCNGWRIPKSLKMLTLLLQYGLDINCRDWFGKSYLHHVMHDDSTDRAGWLIDHGVDIDAVDHQAGTTALGLAAAAGQAAMVKFLLGRGASKAVPMDEEWALPEKLAAKAGHKDVSQLLGTV